MKILLFKLPNYPDFLSDMLTSDLIKRYDVTIFNGQTNYNEYDLIIFGSLRRSFPQMMSYYYQVIATYAGKIAVIDGEDDNFIYNMDIRRVVYFKRELFDRSNPAIIPLNFSYYSDVKPSSYEKKYSVMFLGLLSHAGRSFIKKLEMIEDSYITDKKLNYEEYINVIGQSKICINLHGAGQDCQRFWELIGNKSLVLTEPLDLVTTKESFVDGKHYVVAKREDMFITAVSLLDNPDKVKAITDAGYELYNTYHLPEHRVKYMMDHIWK